MTRTRTLGVVIGAGPVDDVREALRAAVGLTLRGDRVEVAIAAEGLAAAGPDGARAASTLAMFQHPVRVLAPDDPVAAAQVEPALAADAVELWAGAAAALTAARVTVTDGPRARLHLLRPGHRVAVATPHDAVLHLPAAGDATADHDDHHDALLDAVLAADTVLVW